MATRRVLWFGAGPARWPEEVLERAARRIGFEAGGGLSVLEESHRGAAYAELSERVEARLRRLIPVPDSHEVLLLPGGATMQFAMVPLNLRRERESADFLLTGSWSKKALEHAASCGGARVAASGEASSFTRVPRAAAWETDPSAAYLHLTSNNTIRGTRVSEFTAPDGVPVVVDASSDVLTRDLPLERIGLLYAGAQKCLGPAGLGIVAIRRDLLARAPETVPAMLRYRDHAAASSRFNTPPTALVWLADLMLEWIEEQGGRAEMHARAEERARLVYEALDAAPEAFEPVAAREDRSHTNITFRLRAGDEEALVAAAAEAGMGGLKGHRSVGGFRVSMYTGMPVDGAARLAEVLAAYARGAGPQGR